MDASERNLIVQQLGEAMSKLSEECYCAGWLGGTEYLVPELCRRAVESCQSQKWGLSEVSLSKARELLSLAEKAGCWADTDYYSIAYEPFHPFPIPPEYIESIEREQLSRPKPPAN